MHVIFSNIPHGHSTGFFTMYYIPYTLLWLTVETVVIL